MVIIQTPLRISFFGGGTDYPVHFREHGGAVLATSIDKYLYTSCRHLGPFHAHKHRITYSKIEDVVDVEQILHPVVREIFKYMHVNDGMEIHADADIPARSGMGSSSSFTVGLLHALYALRGEMVDKTRLALEAMNVEQNLLNENVGCQDQIMAAFGGFKHVRFHTNGGFSTQEVVLKSERLTELNDHMMLFFTGQQRVASHIAAEQVKNAPSRVAELKAMYDMVDEALKILGGNSSILEFGKLLHESWQLKRKLSSKISNSDIDQIYETGMKNGAVGGKLLGAGGGGFVLLFVPPESQLRVSMALKNLLHVKFRFENLGSNIIFYRRQAA